LKVEKVLKEQKPSN